MRKYRLLIFLAINSSLISAQTPLTIEGNIINNYQAGSWEGYNIPRSQPTLLVFKNNSITSVNGAGYMLQAGDEQVAGTNNNLDGEIISGNKLVWNGSDISSITHGVFTGYNINALIIYNYLNKVPMGLLRKSNGMINTSGGIAYNIVLNPLVAAVAKGINNVDIFNNTFYSTLRPSETWRGLVDIYTNTDDGLNTPSRGTRVFNNIFYTRYQISNIYVYEAECLSGFESDYNIFYCESGTPMFNYLGTKITFSAWQDLGFDTHSVVVNPDFIDFTDFVPSERLDYGTDLGLTWQKGLSVDADWGTTDPETANQNGTWQVGARIYSTQMVPVTDISVEGAFGSNTIDTDNGTLQLSAEVLPANATDKSVEWSVTNATGQALISQSGLVTAIENGTVVARATAKDGSGVYGTLVINISSQITPVNNITITGAGGASIISTDNGTLQLTATVLPVTATDKTITWSLINGSGQATINTSGLVTASDNGSVTARATANDGSGVTGDLIIIISNQMIPVTGVTVTGAGGESTITQDNGSLQLNAAILPSNATDKTVTWSVQNGTGQASINSSGLLTAIQNGSVTAMASANDGSGIHGSIVIAISNQVIQVTGITVTGEGGRSTIPIDDGTLQLLADVQPADATNKSITWAIINGAGLATINSTGLVTAFDNGTVTVRASANDGSGASGTFVIGISSQIIPVTSITITGMGGITSINTDNGSLQLIETIMPVNATDKTTTWSIINDTGQASISSSGLVTAIQNGTVTARAEANDMSGTYGAIVISISNQIIPVTGIIVNGTGGATSINSDNGSLQLIATLSPANATDKTVTWSSLNGTGECTISADGLVTAISNGTVTAIATANDGTGLSGSILLTISNQILPVTGITVTGAGGATLITEENGTLQLNAEVLPANATDKSVVWSVVNGTGQATIIPSGLITAVNNGLVSAIATAHDGSGVTGMLTITIATDIIPVSGITVTGEDDAITISTDHGSLQMSAAVLPLNASDNRVTWSVTNGTGEADISSSGLVTAVSNGTVVVRAASVDGSGIYGTQIITISNQVIPVTGITVSGEGGTMVITTDNGTLQLHATVLPSDATDKSVVWSVLNGTGEALINASGLVTATDNGTITAVATANDGSAVSGSLLITISNQIIPVTSIVVTSSGGQTAIVTDNGSLQLDAAVLPVNATDKTVVWSIINGTERALLDATGRITALDNGSVTVRASAGDGSGVSGTFIITISNQVIPVTGITVSGAGGMTAISTDDGSLQLSEEVLPSNATNKGVSWSVVNGTGEAVITASGMLTAIDNGTVTVKATAIDGSGVYGTLIITISNQIIPVTGINVTGADGATSISTDNGTLQLFAEVLPLNATDNSVTWTVINETGQATINSNGRVTAVLNGTVTVRATANDGSGVSDTFVVNISNQVVPVTGISIAGTGGATTITTDNGTLQLIESVLPVNATTRTVSWTVINGTGQAVISSTGLMTAIDNGLVTAIATATDGSGVSGSIIITISNQIIPVAGINVSGAGGATIITVNDGFLQLSAGVTPANATNKTVTWSVINGTGAASINPAGRITAIGNGTVTARATANDGSGISGTLVITIFNQITSVTAITITGAGGVNTITTDNGSLQMSASISPVTATDKSVTWSIINGSGVAGINSLGLVTAFDNGTVTVHATANDGSGIVGSRVITISNQAGPVTGIIVTGSGGGNTITTDNGSLQLTASVLPTNATVKTVTWSIINGTGQASINSTGLLSAIDNGTVTARATAKDGSGVYGTLVVLISNQIVPVNSIILIGEGGASTINTDNGTLQLSAQVLPLNAVDKSVVWSMIDGTGQATINSTGLVTAVYNGTVTARAASKDGSGVYGALIITISNQIIPLTAISVTGSDGETTINTDNGSLQLNAIVLPANATDLTVRWSIENITGNADISATGLVTAADNGTVRAIATANDGSGISGNLVITISNQIIPVAAITIVGADGATTITEEDASLQLNALISPANATNKSVLWSLVNITGQATIDSYGLVTATGNGLVIVKATANDGSGICGEMNIPISIELSEFMSLTVTRDEIKIHLNESYISWKAGLFNLQGTMILTKTVDNAIFRIDISKIPSGIYILALSKGENLKSAKIIKP